MPAVAVENVCKAFGKTPALQGIDLYVPESTVVGVLGPNGAGKSTLIRILATLLKPDYGRAEVFGVDVARHPQEVRRMISLTGQYAAVDELLTGMENLVMIGRILQMPRKKARERADQLLAEFDLTEAAGRPVRTYSGGMRRRLDLATSLMSRPRLLFLDEPTAGLDPSGRIALWDHVQQLADAGTTILLTTQYLEEADRLAESVVVVDDGRLVVKGRPEELKGRAGHTRIEITLDDRGSVDAAASVVDRHVNDVQPDPELGRLLVRSQTPTQVLPDLIRGLDTAGIPLVDLEVHRPTLDDVFAAVTTNDPAHSLVDAADTGGAGSARN